MFRRAGHGCVRIDLGAECGVVEKSGAWFGFEGERIGQGRKNAKQFLRDHLDMARRLEVKVLAHHGIKREPEGGAGAAAAGWAAGRSAAASGGLSTR
jgi:recombination protein RecA